MKRLHLGETNLNLFLALEALLTEGSVTRAARRLGLTQPAMSHALRRLRDLYGDELLVRGRAGMVPTPLAVSLLPSLRTGLAELERVLNGDLAFDPAASTRAFSLATVDYPQMAGLPAALARLRREAPGVDVRVRGLAGDLADALETGVLDAVLAGGEVEQQLALDRGLMRQWIIGEDFVCIVRRDHPAVGEALDLDTYCALPHALVSTGGSARGMVDAALEGMGRARRVALTVPGFVGAPYAVAGADLIATVPRGVAEHAATFLPLRLLTPPLPMPRSMAYLWWHQRFQHDPGHTWWRRVLIDAFAPYRTGETPPPRPHSP